MEERRGNIFLDLAGLFLPRCCSGCDRSLMNFETCICTRCVQDLPRMRTHDVPDNTVEQVFRGRLRLHSAAAFLQFNKEGMVQHMLHRLKYRGDKEVGYELGRRMAQEVMFSPRFADVQVLMAVPLHRRKEIQRGYNQSQLLVDGMLQEWPLKDGGRSLRRVVQTSSQTKRGRLSRWSNVKEAFLLDEPDRFRGAHILLVDDVVTTGATLEGCAKALEAVPDVRISVLTCACA